MTESKEQLFETLGMKHMDEIYTAAIRLTENAEKAEILVQQTYAYAFNDFEKFDKNSDFNKWLIAILLLAYANLYTHLRKDAAGN